MTHPIPSAALDDRLGFTGTAGSGKTYNAGSAAERLIHENKRVVIPDPLGVWWGLRLNADGKSKGFDVIIFGGPHGDLPLTEHAGALIGETVAGMKESCILDLSELGTKASERRFMLAFLTALYRKATGEPLHVIFDEADMWAPQKLLDKEGDAAKLLGMMETIVRRGRVKGFIPWLITQRPAVLSKDVLSQVDGLISFKLTSSQDRDAIGNWVEGSADKAQWREIWSSMPTLERGQGVIWLPARGILDTARFPKKATFDSSATPKRGQKAQSRSLKPLNIDALKERLATVDADRKADDPKALRGEVTRLKGEIAKLEKQLTAKAGSGKPVDRDALRAAEERGFERAKKKLTTAAQREANDRIKKGLVGVLGYVTALVDTVNADLADLKKQDTALAIEDTPAPQPPVLARPNSSVAPKRPAQLKPVASDGTYTAPQLKVLRSLAMWQALGHDTPSREMVAAASGYSPSSGGFNNLLGGLATMGAIGKPMAGRVSLLVDAETMGKEDGRDMLLGHLSNPQRRLIAALVDQPNATSREQLGEATNYSASSGGFNNLIGSLSTLGIIEKPQAGYVALSAWAQELLSGHAERMAA